MALGRTDYLVRSKPGELYLAGLLHDIGKIILLVNRPRDFERCLELSAQGNAPLYQVERDINSISFKDPGKFILNPP